MDNNDGAKVFPSNIFYLRLEQLVNGYKFESVADEAIKISKRLNLEIHFEYKNIAFEVRPDTEVYSLLEKYIKKLEDKVSETEITRRV